MISREQIKKYLHANGVSINSSEEEIKSVLFSAKWHEKDVDTALTVLQEDPETHKQTVNSLHKVFHTDDRLQPETISALLGIDVDIRPQDERERTSRGSVGFSEFMIITGIACLFTIGFFILIMWVFEMGPFYTGTISASAGW